MDVSLGRYGSSSFWPWVMLPRWMTPRAAVAENLDQLTALLSHSRFSRKNESFVVPEFIKAFANVMPVWNIEFRASRLSLSLCRMVLSVRLHRKRNSRFSSMVLVPRRMLLIDE